MDQADGKISAIQLLRAIAAGVVAVLHIAFAFADHIGDGLGLPPVGSHAPQSAVALFFIVSGYIMVISSRRLFGTAGATRLFWIRRCVRILPPYWLATLLLVAVMLYLGRGVPGDWLFTSLMLFPTDTGAFVGRPLFLLWPGWTLFYEMVFYFLFGLGLAWGRLPAIGVATTAIVALVVAGQVMDLHGAVLVSLTRPVLLIFLGGMALALFRERGLSLPPSARWISLALALAAFLTVDPPAGPDTLGLRYTLWAGLPALLLAIAVMGGPLHIAHARLVNRLGDTSYALYLLHLPLTMLAISVFPLRFGAWPFLLAAIILAYGASLLAFLYVERPLTRFLNDRLAGPQHGDRLLQQTGV